MVWFQGMGVRGGRDGYDDMVSLRAIRGWVTWSHWQFGWTEIAQTGVRSISTLVLSMASAPMGYYTYTTHGQDRA